jgi:hypothetical protein
MIYGLSLLFLLLALVFGIPAVREWRRMRRIDRRAASTMGVVTSSSSAMGWMWTASFGNQDRPLVGYSLPHGEPMVLEIVTSSVLPRRRYRPARPLHRLRPGPAWGGLRKAGEGSSCRKCGRSEALSGDRLLSDQGDSTCRSELCEPRPVDAGLASSFPVEGAREKVVFYS